jgi:hypothetical protein
LVEKNREVYDENSFMQDVQRQSRHLLYQPSIEEFDIGRNKFFAYSHEVYRGVKRREFLHAASSLDTLRLFITTGWFMLAGMPPNNPGYWANLGGNRSRLESWQEAFLEKAGFTHDEESLMNSLIILITEFQRVHHMLCKKVGVEENQEQLRRIFNLIR